MTSQPEAVCRIEGLSPKYLRSATYLIMTARVRLRITNSEELSAHLLSSEQGTFWQVTKLH